MLIELISLGTVNETLVKPMEVFSVALQKRVVKMILCHNHPSGNLKHSEKDVDITDRLYQVGRIVDCPVLDHFIITTTSYVSFADIGLMDTISKSTKYVPRYEMQKRIKEEAEQIGQKRREIEIAKEMKRAKYPNEEIAKLTGLPIEEIKKLRVRNKKTKSDKDQEENKD